jgi:inositol oxygenase
MARSAERRHSEGPLPDLDDRESARPGPAATGADRTDKYPSAFRNYEADVQPRIREFHRLNHTRQTLGLVLAKKSGFLSESRQVMGIWEAMEFLNTRVEGSDPDTDHSQIEHLMQTTDAICADGHRRWFILTGLIHDLGKTNISIKWSRTTSPRRPRP